MKDRAWFFGGFQYFRSAATQPGVDPRFPRALETERVFYKLTWQLSDSMRLMHSMHDDLWALPGGASTDTPDFASTARGSGHNPSFTFAELTHLLSTDTFYDARVSGFISPDDRTELNGNFGQSGRQDVTTGIWSGGFPFSGGFRQARIAVHGKLSHYATDFLGADHDFKFGVQYVNAWHEGHYGYTNDAVYYDYAGEPYYGVFRERYDYGGQFDNTGAFAQDIVRIGDRLTLELGLRFDHIDGASQDIPRLDADFNDIGEVQGLGRLYTWNNLAPRLGFNVQLDEAGRTILRGNWGRYFRGAQTSELSSNHPGFTPISVAFFDPSTGGYTDVVAVIDPIADIRIDPDTRAPRTDQFSIGVDHDLGSDMALALTYIKKDGRYFPGWQVLNAEYGRDTATLENGQTIEVFPITTDPSDRVFNLTSREDFYSDYDGVLLSFERRWSNGWQALLSYMWSESKGLIQSNWRPPGGGQNTRVTGFTSRAGRDPNDFTNAAGNLRNDRTHMIRFQGAVQLPWDILLGANLRNLTGKPWAAEARVRLPQGSQRIFIEPMGARRLSTIHILDVRDRQDTFRFGQTGRLELQANVFNLTNDQPEEELISTLFTSPNFDVPERWPAPRQADDRHQVRLLSVGLPPAALQLLIVSTLMAGDVTLLLRRWTEGDREALDELVPEVYAELRRLSRHYLRRGPRGSMQTTALINEAFVRLIDQDGVDWESRKQFFGIAARTMRNILVDQVRRKTAEKRGGGFEDIPFDEERFAVDSDRRWDLLALDEALTKLSEVDPELSRLVELRFFGGLTVDETAEAMGVSPATVKRNWQTAKIWLYRELDAR